MRLYIFISTGLLCLFSCNKQRQQVLASHVIQTEKQVSVLNLAEYDRGDWLRRDITEEINTTPNNRENKNKLSRLKAADLEMEEIDKATAYLICMIDRFKIRLLKDCGENMRPNGPNENRILQRKYDPKDPLMPVGLNLSGIRSAAETINDFPVRFLMQHLDQYKRKMLRQLAAVGSGIKIHDERTRNRVSMLLAEDQEASYNDLPLITVIQNLSLLENRILSARSICLENVSDQVNNMASGGMFDMAQALVYGPDVVKRGDEIELKVIVASFETGNQNVKSNLGTVSIENNVPAVKVKAGSNTPLRLHGTLDFKMKSGVSRRYPWEKTIFIRK